MKKIALLALGLSTIINTSYAQLYIRAGLGYAFPLAGQTIDGSSTPYSGSQNNSGTQTYNLKSASFSSGFQGVLGCGYMFNPHIGIQLDGGIGISNTKYTFSDNNIQLQGGVPGSISIIEQAKNPFLLIPSLVLQTGGNKWNIYSRMGLALPLNSKITLDQVEQNAPGTGALTVYDFTLQIKNSFSVGLTAAAGVKYKINDMFDIWGEVSMLSMSLFIKEADLNNFSVNGQSTSLSYVTSPHVINYSKNVTVDSTGANLPTYSQPFSNVGINLGVSIRLSERRGRSNNDMEDDKNFKRKRF